MRTKANCSNVCLWLSICLALATVATMSAFGQKAGLRSPDARLTLAAGNGIYNLFIEDGTGFWCGTWTATTGAAHPAGPGFNVLYGQGFPATSNTTLRSYSSGSDYVTGRPGACTALCDVAAPVVVPLMNGAFTVGFRLTWTFADAGNSVEFVQEVEVVGPVDGSETIDNSVIRESHTVRNLGPGSLSYGIRKQWDWQIGFDDGPFLGDCESPNAACDRSLNLTGDGSLDGFYPQSYTINEDPGVAMCPAMIQPNNPAGCGGNPLYLVAGTVMPPSGLTPQPDPPELFQFNAWPLLFSTCWLPVLIDNATCAGGDTAAAYFYGLSAGTALTLAAGQEKTFTQYVVAGEDTCPDVITGLEVTIDIKFCSNPNAFNCRNRGVTPVTVFGDANVDVSQIDIPSLRLCLASDDTQCTGAPHSWSFDDRGDPLTDPGARACAVIDGVEQRFLNPDGFQDLDVGFSSPEVAALIACADLSKKSVSPTLILLGTLTDGTPFRSTAVNDVGIDQLFLQNN